MHRNKPEAKQGSPIANLTWKTMDLVFWPLRESASVARQLLDAREADAPNRTDAEEPETEPATDESPTEERADASDAAAEASAPLEDVWGVGAARAPKLRDQGLSSLRDVAEADLDALTALPGVGRETAERIKKSAAALADGD